MTGRTFNSPEDIDPLVTHLLGNIAKSRGSKLKLDKEALVAVRSYDWPGNVRQLENALERAAAFCKDGVIAPGDLPAEITGRNVS